MGTPLDAVQVQEHSLDANETLLTRLASMENSIAAVRRQLGRLDLAERHADSMRVLGAPFSGVRLCGFCVELVVNDRFTVDGSFSGGDPDDMIIVLNNHDMTVAFTSLLWKWDSCVAWKWDDDVLRAWGPVKCDDVRGRMLAWFRDDPYRQDNPAPEDVGAGPSHHHEAFDAIHEAALKSRHPGLLAIGRTGVAVAKSCSIRTAVGIMDAIATDLGCQDKMFARFDIYRVPSALRALALTILTERPEHCSKRNSAWMALSDSVRKELTLDSFKPRTFTFFTPDRLARCR